MGRGRPKNTGARRAQIVDGLLDVISERGYERASIAAIAGAAGLAPGLVHYHFKTKQAVLVALAERLVESLEARYDAGQAVDDPAAHLDAFIDAHLAVGEAADPRAVAAWVVVGAESVRQPEVRDVYAAAITRRLATLQTLCAACLRQGQGSAHGASAAAASILAAIEGAFTIAVAAPGAIPPGTAAPTVRKMARAIVVA